MIGRIVLAISLANAAFHVVDHERFAMQADSVERVRTRDTWACLQFSIVQHTQSMFTNIPPGQTGPTSLILRGTPSGKAAKLKPARPGRRPNREDKGQAAVVEHSSKAGADIRSVMGSSPTASATMNHQCTKGNTHVIAERRFRDYPQ